MLVSSKRIRMPVDSLDGFGQNLNVCVRADRVVWYASCPCDTTTRDSHQDADQTAFFVYARAVLRTIAVSLHGLLGVKHWLALTPVARHPNSQRGIGQHALDQGGRQQGHGRNRWLMAALARHQEVRLVGEGGASSPGEAMPKQNAELLSPQSIPGRLS